MNWTYFLLIGWWFGLLWFCVALLMCWNPIGWAMAYKTPDVIFGP